eukprot:scaffold57877_cov41-Cyclotella_meneghiniana.AAC.2
MPFAFASQSPSPVQANSDLPATYPLPALLPLCAYLCCNAQHTPMWRLSAPDASAPFVGPIACWAIGTRVTPRAGVAIWTLVAVLWLTIL